MVGGFVHTFGKLISGRRFTLQLCGAGRCRLVQVVQVVHGGADLCRMGLGGNICGWKTRISALFVGWRIVGFAGIVVFRACQTVVCCRFGMHDVRLICMVMHSFWPEADQTIARSGMCGDNGHCGVSYIWFLTFEILGLVEKGKRWCLTGIWCLTMSW